MSDEKSASLAAFERGKYLKAYERTRYREKSPHKRALPHIQAWMSEYGIKRYVNFGCGSGLLDRYLLQDARGILLDHVDALWEDVKTHPNLEKFIEASLFTDFEPFQEAYGVSTDVMEHIPTEMVDTVLKNIADRVETCFFQISMSPSGDRDEEKYGGHLHLTVERPDWWTQRLSKHFAHLYEPRVDILPSEAPWGKTREWFLVTASQKDRESLRASWSHAQRKASS